VKPGLPAHYELTRSQFACSAVSIAMAFALLGIATVRIVRGVDLWHWWMPIAFVAGLATADFTSGLVHWAADTWLRDDCPIIGRRLLVPFRIHHINPHDFLRRRFVDTNGEVAVLAIPVLLALGTVPLDRDWGAALAVFGLAFCGIGSLTNQIHQWAHMPSPPRAVRLLQSTGLVLGAAEHTRHHARPYDCRYCITTGWCNGPLDAVDFFRRMETMIMRLTGALPRQDDRRYEQRHQSEVASGSSQLARQPPARLT
jgi:ubiquitin-conjugating enzyme E2 variant